MSPTGRLSALKLLKEQSPSKDLLDAEIASIHRDQVKAGEHVVSEQQEEVDRIRTKARYWKLADQNVASTRRSGKPKATSLPNSAPPISSCALVHLSILSRSVTAALVAITFVYRSHFKPLFSLINSCCRRPQVTCTHLAKQGCNLPIHARPKLQQHDTLCQRDRSCPPADGPYRRAIIAQQTALQANTWVRL